MPWTADREDTQEQSLEEEITGLPAARLFQGICDEVTSSTEYLFRRFPPFEHARSRS